jgi:hypothetical protein
LRRDLRDGRIGRQSARNQSRRRGSPRHDFFTSPAGVFGTAHDKHAQLRGDDVQPLAHVVPNPMQHMMAARTSVILDVGHHLDARQMLREERHGLDGPGRAFGAPGRTGLVCIGLAARERLLDVFQTEQLFPLAFQIASPHQGLSTRLGSDLKC